MNPHTGDLKMLAVGEGLPAGFEALLSKRLKEAAQTELAGRTETRVDLSKRGPLQDWAKKKRKAKVAAKSRRRNRA